MRMLAAIALCCLLAACEREARTFRPATPATSPAGGAPNTTLYAGPVAPAAPAPTGPKLQGSAESPYAESAYATAEGMRLYNAFNCVGCHAHGGGDKGPALMDDKWIYGSSPQDIHDSIVQGRPGGMPSFRGKIPEFQVWQIVAYVRSLSGQLPKDVSPGRSDHMSARPVPAQTERETPRKQ